MNGIHVAHELAKTAGLDVKVIQIYIYWEGGFWCQRLSFKCTSAVSPRVFWFDREWGMRRHVLVMISSFTRRLLRGGERSRIFKIPCLWQRFLAEFQADGPIFPFLLTLYSLVKKQMKLFFLGHGSLSYWCQSAGKITSGQEDFAWYTSKMYTEECA